MRDVAMPYRATVQEERTGRSSIAAMVCFWLGTLILGFVLVDAFLTWKHSLEQRLAASEACLNNLHITMTRLDNSGPERGATVATVTCKGE